MTDPTTTPTPTLTDEQIDGARDALRDAWYSTTDERIPDTPFSLWLAAVIARARREARDGMASDLALLIDQECPHEPDEHAEGTCEVCDYAFAMAQMVRDYAEACNETR